MVNFPRLGDKSRQKREKTQNSAPFFMGLIQLRLLSYRPGRHIIFTVVAAEDTCMLADMHCQTGWSSLLSLLGRSDWGYLQFLSFLCEQSGLIWSASMYLQPYCP